MIVTRDADIDRAVNADRLGRAAQHRPALHLDRAGLRRGADLRRVRRQAARAGRDPAPGRRRRHLQRRGRSDDLAGAGRHRLRAGRGRARRRGADPHRRQAQGRPRRLVRADRDRRRRPLDEGDARGDLRSGDPGDEGQGRRAGDRARQRHDLRPGLLGLRGGPRRGRADRAPGRGRALQRQRRAHQLQHPRAADGRLEELRDRRPPRRPGNPPLLPHRGADDPAPPDGEVGAGLVPVQRAQARRRPPPLHAAQRARAAQPPRARPAQADRVRRHRRPHALARPALGEPQPSPPDGPAGADQPGRPALGPGRLRDGRLLDGLGPVGRARERRAHRDDRDLDQLPAHGARGRRDLRVDPRPPQRPGRGAALRGLRRARPPAGDRDRQLPIFPARCAAGVTGHELLARRRRRSLDEPAIRRRCSTRLAPCIQSARDAARTSHKAHTQHALPANATAGAPTDQPKRRPRTLLRPMRTYVRARGGHDPARRRRRVLRLGRAAGRPGPARAPGGRSGPGS